MAGTGSGFIGLLVGCPSASHQLTRGLLHIAGPADADIEAVRYFRAAVAKSDGAHYDCFRARVGVRVRGLSSFSALG